MTDQTWLAALDHELEARGVAAAVRAAVVVETEGFLAAVDEPALAHFGAPAAYAASLVDALGGQRRRPVPDGAPVVRAAGVHKAFGSTRVLVDASLEVRSGEIIALIGPNGAGKSTFLRILAGLEAADAGTVAVDGRVGYVPQHGGLGEWLTPAEHFALFGAVGGGGRRAAVAKGVRLAHELGWDPRDAGLTGQLSGGTRQKLSVVVALLGEPDVLLLDEPYQGMDTDGMRRFWELLWSEGEQGRAAIVSSHSPDVLERATSVIELAAVRA